MPTYDSDKGGPKGFETRSDGRQLPVHVNEPCKGAPTDRSGTITTGGVAQTLAPENLGRVYLAIQNTGIEASPDDLWVNFGTNAVESQPSWRIPPGQSYSWEGTYVPTSSVSIRSATTGIGFTAKEA